MKIRRTQLKPKFVVYYRGVAEEFATQVSVRNISDEPVTFNMWLVFPPHGKRKKKVLVLPYFIDYEVSPGGVLLFPITSVALGKKDFIKMRASKNSTLVITIVGIV